jgi:Protein of unknown function (DUF3237)
MDRLYQGEIVDPGAYYFRTTPYFETSSEKYSWMNRICSIRQHGNLSSALRLFVLGHYRAQVDARKSAERHTDENGRPADRAA